MTKTDKSEEMFFDRINRIDRTGVRRKESKCTDVLTDTFFASH